MLLNHITYDRYFQPGIRVRLAIPLTGGEVFREWGLVDSLELNLITLNLSRRILPDKVQISIGSILELKVMVQSTTYSCRGIVIQEYDGTQLIMELISDVVTNELREYFRIDTYLPMRYRLLPSQNSETANHAWQDARHELNEKLAKQQKSPLGLDLLAAVADEQEWSQVLPTATNISGGGIRSPFPIGAAKGDLYLIDLLVPLSPPRHVITIARVVYATAINFPDTDETFYDTAMHFLEIDERDRDHLIGYISELELRRIREFRKSYLSYALTRDERSGPQTNWERYLLRLIYLLIALVAAFYLVNGLVSYKKGHDKGAIERSFEESIEKYKEMHQH